MGEYKEAWASCLKSNILVSDGQRKRHPNHQTDQKTDPWSNEQMKQTMENPKENPTDKTEDETDKDALDGQTDSAFLAIGLTTEAKRRITRFIETN